MNLSLSKQVEAYKELKIDLVLFDTSQNCSHESNENSCTVNIRDVFDDSYFQPQITIGDTKISPYFGILPPKIHI